MLLLGGFHKSIRQIAVFRWYSPGGGERKDGFCRRHVHDGGKRERIVDAEHLNVAAIDKTSFAAFEVAVC